MPPIDGSITVWSFGQDFALIGLKAGTTIDNNNISIYAAYEQNYQGKPNGFVGDISYGYHAYSSDKFNLSVGARLRGRTTNETLEIRPQVDMSGKITKDMNWYATVYDREIHSSNGNPSQNTHGAFAGLTYNTGWGKVMGEFQVDSGSGAGCNFGLSVNL